MLRSLKRLLSIRSQPKPEQSSEGKWTADFSKPKTIRFDIKSETSYDANLRKFGSHHCLSLGLKKKGCMAWVEAPDFRYRDLVIEGRLHIDSRGGYASGGIMFRMLDDLTYYSFLVSNKGFFRLDLVRNGTPFPLIGWTEVPDSAAVDIAAHNSVDFTIIAYSDNIIILTGGCWTAELKESSIYEGSVSFACASYEAPASYEEATSYEEESFYGTDGSGKNDAENNIPASSGYDADSSFLLNPWAEGSINPYYAEVFLESFSIDSRIDEVSAMCEKWKGSLADPCAHFHLAETFAAMNQPNAAMVQIKKAWEAPDHQKTQKELLLAGRLAGILGFPTEAEAHISACFQANVDSPEGKAAVTEMAKILYDGERFLELKKYCTTAIKLKPDDPIVLNFKGHAHWNLQEYTKAASAYDKAFKLDNNNGLLAKNAANVYEALEKRPEAKERYLAACRAFLAEDNYADLGILVPKILLLGETDAEAHALAGKWAFGVEDWKMAEKEFKKAHNLEKSSGLPHDPALVYLEALLLIQKGKRKQALPLLEEAVSLNKDYALFRFRLAENRFLLKNNPHDPKLNEDLEAALALDPKDGWINNLAAQINLEKGNLEAASEYMAKAASALGGIADIKLNRAVLLSRMGSVDEALKLLASGSDVDGIFANCAANILVDAERFEEADNYYRKAISASPDNVEFLSNRASCLIELRLYGEADTLLEKINSIDPSPSVLEKISYVAARKGEYLRAESACRSALEMDPHHAPSLLSLGWTLINLGRTSKLDEVLSSLDSLKLSSVSKRSRDDLAKRYDEFANQTISCDSCGHSWKVPKVTELTPGIRLMAVPPDDLPAGSCTACGKTWCIGCAKNNLDSKGRFVCVHCGKPLKLVNEGLKKLVYDWASQSGLTSSKESDPPETAPTQPETAEPLPQSENERGDSP